MNLLAKCGQGTQEHVCETHANNLSNKKMEVTDDYTTTILHAISESCKAYKGDMSGHVGLVFRKSQLNGFQVQFQPVTQKRRILQISLNLQRYCIP
jgi:hypothetical protein